MYYVKSQVIDAWFPSHYKKEILIVLKDEVEIADAYDHQSSSGMLLL